MDTAIEVRQPRKDLPRRRARRPGHQLQRAPWRGVRAARPERRRKVDDGRHAHDDGAPELRDRRAGRLRRRALAARGAVDLERRLPGGRGRPRPHRPAQPRHPRPPLAGRRRPTPATASPSSPGRSASPTCSTARSAPTAEASGGGSRSPARWCRARGCSSSTSRPSASTRASGRSCSTSSPASAIAWRRRSCSRPTTSTRPSGSATGWRSCTRAGSSPSTHPRALRADLGERIVELRVRDEPAAALGRLRGRGLAGADAFTVGATITIPLHDRDDSDGDRRDRIVGARTGRDHDPRADARRRLPAPDRRPASRRRLTREEHEMTTATHELGRPLPRLPATRSARWRRSRAAAST